ncbi:MAG: hypothetical protein HGA85_09495, partial [Nanoarchaeota archaeon]|nr:hypothetical protein [Nanoarchaeota archaeon]
MTPLIGLTVDKYLDLCDVYMKGGQAGMYQLVYSTLPGRRHLQGDIETVMLNFGMSAINESNYNEILKDAFHPMFRGQHADKEVVQNVRLGITLPLFYNAKEEFLLTGATNPLPVVPMERIGGQVIANPEFFVSEAIQNVGLYKELGLANRIYIFEGENATALNLNSSSNSELTEKMTGMLSKDKHLRYSPALHAVWRQDRFDVQI